MEGPSSIILDTSMSADDLKKQLEDACPSYHVYLQPKFNPPSKPSSVNSESSDTSESAPESTADRIPDDLDEDSLSTTSDHWNPRPREFDYSQATPFVMKFFQDTNSVNIKNTLKNVFHIEVEALQLLLDFCEKNGQSDAHTQVVDIVHKEIKKRGYPEEWASAMIQTYAISERDRLIIKLSNLSLELEELAKEMNGKFTRYFEVK